MMGEVEKKPWMAHLPGILAGSAALVAALTTIYVNVRNAAPDSAKITSVPVQTNPVATATSTSAPASIKTSKVALRLERIRVDNDGSLGTTDWTFEIDADGTPLYSLPVKSLDDREGRNLRMMPANSTASGLFDVSNARAVAVSVKGWKHGLLSGAGAPDVTGQGWMASGVDTVTVAAKSAQAGRAAFVFYFSASKMTDAHK
jgi:hypothetical protein